MGFKPLEMMWERVDTAREDSDALLFLNLLYMGELITKLVAAGLVAAVMDDRQRHRYRLLHRLVRADSLGEWATAIEDVLTGPASQYLAPEARDEQKELTQRLGQDTWQYDAVARLHACVRVADPGLEDLPSKTDLRRWFSLFSVLRNKTRGHGAPRAEVCRAVSESLLLSLKLVTDNFSLFRRQWAFLYRNLSGKYRVIKLTEDASRFDPLKTGRFGSLPSLADGIYVHCGNPGPSRVDLVESSVDAVDFFLPNGNFNGKRYELLSYISGSTKDADARPYLTPATELPVSETQGISDLNVYGHCFANLPPCQSGYIHREGLENEIRAVLLDDRHPVVTLVGRGGIGKTWLALAALHSIVDLDRFAAILWFSARDIDLLAEGPKLVAPHVLTESDVAREFMDLMGPASASEKGFRPELYLANCLTSSPVGPILFVFDNFETVRSPVDLYAWIDTYVRSPNKVLITTRFREFKGDYPVEIGGMTELEVEKLVAATARDLGISKLVTEDYRHELYRESDGHPYVIKVLLGEVAKAGKLLRVERVIATQEGILDALFERTYSGLSPVAKRVFLTLANWRSTVPQLALEAVLLRPVNERMDVPDAIEELSRSSFIEIFISDQDSQLFLTIPLVAAVFGKRKLAVSPMRSAVEADTQLLRYFGAAQPSDVQHGIAPRVERLFRNIASRIGDNAAEFEDYLPMIELIASKYSRAWLLLASLYQEINVEGALERAKAAVQRYLETRPDSHLQRSAWETLAQLCLRTNDALGEVHALIEMCNTPGVPYKRISDAASRLNQLFRQQYFGVDTDEKQIIVQRLISIMGQRISEADAVDCSRLAWLCLHSRDEQRAREYVDLGLTLDPYDEYCLNLDKRI